MSNNTSARSSIADLAPFVAAVLKDRSLHDLVEENKRLTEENNWLKEDKMLLQVFNASLEGHPLCYQGSPARDGRILRRPNGNLFLRVVVEAIGDPPVSIDLNHHVIEIRLGGVAVYKSTAAEHIYDDSSAVKGIIVDSFSEPHGIGAIVFDTEMIPSVMTALGPSIFREVHNTLIPYESVEDRPEESDDDM